MTRWSIAVLCGLGACALAYALAQPPLPFAAADRLFERFAWVTAPARPQSPDIVIVGIDDATVSNFPYRSPIDRAFMAAMISALDRAGVRAIGIDLVFDQPTEPSKDAALMAVLDMVKAPTICVSVAAETPLPLLRRAYLNTFLRHCRSGFANLARERYDEMIREHLPNLHNQPSFPVAIAAALGVALPTTSPFPIEWRSAPANTTSFAFYPANLVASLPPSWLAGKIVLIGTVIPGEDEHRTVLSRFAGQMHGVEIHAHVLSQILEHRTHETPPYVIGATLVFAAIGMGLALLSGAPMIAVLVFAAAIPWAGSLIAFHYSGLLVPALAPTFALIFGAGSVRFWRGRQDRRERKVLMQLFSRFVSAPVADQIWHERETILAGVRPKPQLLTATVLFSDVANFTAICEGLDPTVFNEWLDHYIDAMTAAVAQHNGVVLRFIGDGILAAFGAPVPRTSEAEIAADAQNAVDCAIAMRRTMATLNAQWHARSLPVTGIRIGIDTGVMTAGSMGSGGHLEYCLNGDSVNTAARLEVLCKQHATGPTDVVILISGATHRLVTVQADAVGKVSLKGKLQTVPIFRVTPQNVDVSADGGTVSHQQ